MGGSIETLCGKEICQEEEADLKNIQAPENITIDPVLKQRMRFLILKMRFPLLLAQAKAKQCKNFNSDEGRETLRKTVF
jgi:hypothetical protein